MTWFSIIDLFTEQRFSNLFKKQLVYKLIIILCCFGQGYWSETHLFINSADIYKASHEIITIESGIKRYSSCHRCIHMSPEHRQGNRGMTLQANFTVKHIGVGRYVYNVEISSTWWDCFRKKRGLKQGQNRKWFYLNASSSPSLSILLNNQALDVFNKYYQ